MYFVIRKVSANLVLNNMLQRTFSKLNPDPDLRRNLLASVAQDHGLRKCIFPGNIVTFPTISYVFLYVRSQHLLQIVKLPTNLITRLPFFPTMPKTLHKLVNNLRGKHSTVIRPRCDNILRWRIKLIFIYHVYAKGDCAKCDMHTGTKFYFSSFVFNLHWIRNTFFIH